MVCLHLKLTPETENLFDEARFGAMKPGALFLNAARGKMVDEPALIRALETGRLRGAYVDVTRTEPLPPDDPLWAAPNLLITPHCSDMVSDWQERMAAFFADNLQRYLTGEPILNAQ